VKKILALVGIAFFVLPGLAFGAITYSRSPTGSGDILSPLTIDVSFDDYLADLNCIETDTDWIIYFDYGDGYNTQLYSYDVPSTTLSNVFIVDLPPADYGTIEVACYPNTGNSVSLEGDDTYTIFTIISASLTPLITFPTSTASDLTANVSSLISDPGLLTLVVLVVAVPFGFYVIKKLIALIPKK
jgi:hypothetical protein